MFSLNVHLLLTLIMATSCLPSNTKDHSDLRALPLTSTTRLAQPQRLPQPKINAIGQSLAKIGQRSFLAPTTSQSAVHQGRKFLKVSYLKAVSESGGIPRQQGEELLHKLLSDDYGPCDELSCAKVFGLDPLEVPQFIDETFFEAASSPSAAKSEHSGQRKVLLASLAKEQTLSGAQDASPKEQVARIFLKDPEPVPRRGVAPRSPISQSLVERKVGWDFINALEGFTTTDFMTIRMTESYPDDELMSKGWSPAQISAWRQRSDVIHKGFNKLPAYKGIVYRGLTRLPADQILSWARKMEKQQLIGLGAIDRPALTSATWDPAVAHKFASPSILQKFFSPDTYSVLMIIDQSRGLPIEDLSIFKNEREVILPRDALYKIESMAPAVNSKGSIIMKLHEAPKDAGNPAMRKAS